MGLFDWLLRKDTAKPAAARTSWAEDSDDWEIVRTDGKDVWQKLEETFSVYFADYEVRRSVSASEIGGDAECRAYTYGLYLNGELKLLVMVTGHNKDKKKSYIRAKEQAKKAGVPFLNFFTHFENDSEYVKERLGQYLKYSY